MLQPQLPHLPGGFQVIYFTYLWLLPQISSGHAHARSPAELPARGMWTVLHLLQLHVGLDEWRWVQLCAAPCVVQQAVYSSILPAQEITCFLLPLAGANASQPPSADSGEHLSLTL